MSGKKTRIQCATAIVVVMVSLASCQRQGGLDIRQEKTTKFQERASAVLGRYVKHIDSEIHNARVALSTQNSTSYRGVTADNPYGYSQTQDLSFSPYQFHQTYGIPWGSNPYGPSIYSDYQQRAHRCVDMMNHIPKTAATYRIAMAKLSQCLTSLVYTADPAFNWMYYAGNDRLRALQFYSANFPVTQPYGGAQNNNNYLELMMLLSALGGSNK